jgi:hypothetical protein
MQINEAFQNFAADNCDVGLLHRTRFQLPLTTEGKGLTKSRQEPPAKNSITKVKDNLSRVYRSKVCTL